MTIRVAGSGEACCGNCGKRLEIVCTGGCPEPDAIPRENYVATMKRPRGPERIEERQLGQCNYKRCTDPVAPYHGHGRPTTKCPFHLEMMKGYQKKYMGKKATP